MNRVYKQLLANAFIYRYSKSVTHFFSGGGNNGIRFNRCPLRGKIKNSKIIKRFVSNCVT